MKKLSELLGTKYITNPLTVRLQDLLAEDIEEIYDLSDVIFTPAIEDIINRNARRFRDTSNSERNALLKINEDRGDLFLNSVFLSVYSTMTLPEQIAALDKENVNRLMSIKDVPTAAAMFVLCPKVLFDFDRLYMDVVKYLGINLYKAVDGESKQEVLDKLMALDNRFIRANYDGFSDPRPLVKKDESTYLFGKDEYVFHQVVAGMVPLAIGLEDLTGKPEYRNFLLRLVSNTIPKAGRDLSLLETVEGDF